MACLLETRLRGREGSEDTATEHGFASRLLISLGPALVLLSCQSAAPSPEDFARPLAQLEATLSDTSQPLDADVPLAVRVRLAFGEDADLDLYVTDGDPRSSETVYFAKHTTRGGGRLVNDARCGDAAPRIDAAAFDAMPEGGLRIGVDYHASCGERSKPEPFVVEIVHGARRELRRGVASPGRFDSRFWRYAPPADDHRAEGGE